MSGQSGGDKTQQGTESGSRALRDASDPELMRSMFLAGGQEHSLRVNPPDCSIDRIGNQRNHPATSQCRSEQVAPHLSATPEMSKTGGSSGSTGINDGLSMIERLMPTEGQSIIDRDDSGRTNHPRSLSLFLDVASSPS